MNILYIGQPRDLNVGNGKTVSCIGDTINDWLADETKVIFSNIKLTVPYTPFKPDTISEVLETSNALVVLDELHAIVDKNHTISETCKRHGDVIGLCYRLSKFFRQIRKRGSTTRSTCQTFMDAPLQYRNLMQEQILCEKYNLYNDKLYKCNADKCPSEHKHYIKQKLYRNLDFVLEKPLFDPAPYYEYYDSFEIVDGWVCFDSANTTTKKNKPTYIIRKE
jgi:hypothetical protein